MKKFDAEVCMKQYGGKCVTRDGREVRIIATDAKNPEYPIVGLVMERDGKERVASWPTSGSVYSGLKGSDIDLCLPSPKKEIWVVLKGKNHEIFAMSEQEEGAKVHASFIRGKKKIIRLEFDPEEA